MRLGIDLGGTKTEAALVECGAEGPIRALRRVRVPTPRDQGYEAILRNTAELIREHARQAGDPATIPIGVGMPGGVRRHDGTVKNSNTTCLNGRPFRRDLQQLLGRQVLFDNDANCFALAETLMGAGRPHREGVVFGVILGTGVGGGWVIGGKLWSGLHGIAGEWGHHELYAGDDPSGHPARACYCGRRGCLETYASGPAVEREYASRTAQRLSLAELAVRASADAHAAACLEQLFEAVGRGLATIINIMDPSMIVLGGGVSNLDALYEQVRDRVQAHLFNDELLTPIVRNELGDSAGVLGAALLGYSP